MRLNRYISDAGHCSRREADRLITEGRVRINGKVAVLGQKVMPGDKVTVNGRPIENGAPKKYLLLYKPRGIVCTADTREKYNIVDYLGYPERVYPVGRLDKDSEGIIIMTSDGDIVNRLLRAAGGHEKEYQVTVDKPVTEDFAKRMSAGVPILDRVTLPCKVKRTGKYSFDIVLIQGLNRQIRRMCEYFGYNVTQLKRVRIMNIEIGDMQPGDWRELTRNELDTLMRTLEEKERNAAQAVFEDE